MNFKIRNLVHDELINKIVIQLVGKKDIIYFSISCNS